MKNLTRSKDSAKTIATRALKNSKALEWVVKGVGKMVQYELKKICANSQD